MTLHRCAGGRWPFTLDSISEAAPAERTCGDPPDEIGAPGNLVKAISSRARFPAIVEKHLSHRSCRRPDAYTFFLRMIRPDHVYRWAFVSPIHLFVSMIIFITFIYFTYISTADSLFTVRPDGAALVFYYLRCSDYVRRTHPEQFSQFHRSQRITRLARRRSRGDRRRAGHGRRFSRWRQW